MYAMLIVESTPTFRSSNQSVQNSKLENNVSVDYDSCVQKLTIIGKWHFHWIKRQTNRRKIQNRKITPWSNNVHIVLNSNLEIDAYIDCNYWVWLHNTDNYASGWGEAVSSKNIIKNTGVCGLFWYYFQQMHVESTSNSFPDMYGGHREQQILSIYCSGLP